MWTVLLMWSHPSSLSLCHSFHVRLPITFTPILLLTSIPGPASRSVQLRDEPQACMTDPAQHTEHIQMNFYPKYGWSLPWNKIQWPLVPPLMPSPYTEPTLTCPSSRREQSSLLLCPQAAGTGFAQEDMGTFSSPFSPFQSHLKLLSPLHQEVGFIWLVCLH